MTSITNLAEEQSDALKRLIAEAGTIGLFTGAGISTESGVPDFRSPGSPWTRNAPIAFQDFVASPEARREAWRRKFVMDDLYRGAAPNDGHRALAALVASGRATAVVTQNIDGLHQAAGVPADRVIELHGNGGYATCLSCGRRHELADVRARFEAEGEAPACEACGGPVKSAAVSFGQAMPAEAMRRAREAALGCDLFLAIGSSLLVRPAADLPVLAKRNGATLVIINRQATGLDEAANLLVRGEIGPLLAAAVTIS